MNPTRVYFVRHGESLFNVLSITSGWSDSPLSARGEEQCRIAGLELRDVPFDAVLTSDLGRVRQTTRLLLEANATTVRPVELPQLREQFYGGFEGTPNLDTFAAIFRHLGLAVPAAGFTSLGDLRTVMREAHENLPAGALVDATAAADPLGLAEDWARYQGRVERAVAAVSEAATASRGGNVLVVAHGAVLSAILAHLDPNGYDQRHLGNASISIAEYDGGRYTLTQLGEEAQFELRRPATAVVG